MSGSVCLIDFLINKNLIEVGLIFGRYSVISLSADLRKTLKCQERINMRIGDVNGNLFYIFVRNKIVLATMAAQQGEVGYSLYQNERRSIPILFIYLSLTCIYLAQKSKSALETRKVDKRNSYSLV